MRFRVLRAEGAERDEWRSLVLSLPPELRDIHFLPGYGQIYRSTYGHVPYLAVLDHHDAIVLQPFVVRSINELPFLRESDVPSYFDIANAYGFGGPLYVSGASAGQVDLVDEFERNFVDYCRGHGFASEFTILHPLLLNHRILEGRPDVALHQEKPLVAISLAGGPAVIWSGLSRGQKSSVNRAKRAGVQVRNEDVNAENLGIFERLYLRTMRRHGAAERWYFPGDYFANCLNELGSHHVSLFFARVGDQVAAAHMVLHGFNTAYYHFGGSDENYHECHAGSLLIYETAIWASEQRYQHYFLGGGVTSASDDKLFRFKAGFSKKPLRLFSYGRVMNAEVYEELARLKRSYELRHEGRVSDSNYFPIYRR